MEDDDASGGTQVTTSSGHASGGDVVATPADGDVESAGDGEDDSKGGAVDTCPKVSVEYSAEMKDRSEPLSLDVLMKILVRVPTSSSVHLVFSRKLQSSYFNASAKVRFQEFIKQHPAVGHMALLRCLGHGTSGVLTCRPLDVKRMPPPSADACAQVVIFFALTDFGHDDVAVQ
jgi:hypothetical protein